jgi:signal transduction histidine kinase
METILQQLIGILTAPPGNLIYHLTLAFSVFASLQVALINRRGSLVSANRTLLALNLVLIAQLALFLSSALAWQGVITPHLFLPVFDRFIILFSLIWIGWLWAFPTPERGSRVADILAGLLSLAGLILFLFTYTQWAASGTGEAFNKSWQDITWTVAILVVIFIAIAAVLFKRPQGWEVGFGMMLVLLVGDLAHLFLPGFNGDFSGYLRLAQLAAFPLLPTLLIRHSAQSSTLEPAALARPAAQSQQQVRSLPPIDFPPIRSLNMRAVHVLMELNLQTEPEKVCAGITRAISHMMLADLTYIVAIPGGNLNPVALQCGYDLVREDEAPGIQIEQQRIPGITNHLVKGKMLRIPASDAANPDLRGLSDALGLKGTGNVMLLPLFNNATPWGALLLMTPYSQRSWTTEEQNNLSTETNIIAQVILRCQNKLDQDVEVDHLRSSHEGLTREVSALHKENLRLSADIETLRQAAQKNAATAHAPASIVQADLDGLLALQQENLRIIDGLQNENARLRSEFEQKVPSYSPSSGDMRQMESELRATLEEVARLQNTLASSNVRSLELERKLSQNSIANPEDHEVIASIVQELRQPMSSVMGYTDLLLAESVGILGALQRKFLERVRASTERLRGLLDDLIQITALTNGPLELVQQPLDMGQVIDAAISDVSARMQEKNINMRVEIPEQLPSLQTDRDALQQIITHLLQNASLATPAEGTITLRAGTHREDANEFLIVQVSDEGGGVLPEDLPHVFERRYRADNVLIQGIGDTGVGLSIARTLTMAMGGRIWVESIPNEKSIFSILLPTRPGNGFKPETI